MSIWRGYARCGAVWSGVERCGATQHGSSTRSKDRWIDRREPSRARFVHVQVKDCVFKARLGWTDKRSRQTQGEPTNVSLSGAEERVAPFETWRAGFSLCRRDHRVCARDASDCKTRWLTYDSVLIASGKDGDDDHVKTGFQLFRVDSLHLFLFSLLPRSTVQWYFLLYRKLLYSPISTLFVDSRVHSYMCNF